MYDWDGNGKIDPYDVGQSVSMRLYDEDDTNKRRKPTGGGSSGCMTMIVMMALLSLGAIGMIII